jgi:hypothetical protein
MYIFILLINIISVLSLKLTINQWSQIKSLLLNPGTTPEMKEKINTIIYKKYEKWTGQQAKFFKKKYYFHAKNIKTEDLEIYAYRGLNEAIQKYNPNFPFYVYLQRQIRWNLLKGLTVLQPINYELLTPKNFRKDNVLTDKLNNIWMIVEKLNPRDKIIFKYKYDYYFNKIRTNKEIAEIMDLSNATIIVSLRRTRKVLLESNL